MLSNIVRRPSAADTWQLQKHGQSKTNAWTTQVVFARFALQEFREQVSSRALFSLPCRRGQLGCPQITPLTHHLSTSAFKAWLPDTTGFQLDTEPGGNAPTRATSREGPEGSDRRVFFRVTHKTASRQKVAQRPLAASSNLGSHELVLHVVTSVAPDAAPIAVCPGNMEKRNIAAISLLNA